MPEKKDQVIVKRRAYLFVISKSNYKRVIEVRPAKQGFSLYSEGVLLYYGQTFTTKELEEKFDFWRRLGFLIEIMKLQKQPKVRNK